MPPAENTLQLKVMMQHIRPPIWRRVVVPDNCTLGDLHWIIQHAMGWTNSHLHSFRIGSTTYGMQLEEVEEFGLPMADEEAVLLRTVLRRKNQRLTYEYDFGDSWGHTILVEKIEPAHEPHPQAVCLAGRRACPPEDCGGVWGYERVLRVLKRASSQDDRELREWVGDYDPAHFDPEEVNRLLQPPAPKSK